MELVISHHTQARAGDLDGMFRLRHDVFKARLNGNVPVADDREVGCLDARNPIYMMVRDGRNAVCGYWCLLPTTGSYILKDAFPELLHGQEAPCDGEVWEINHFATGRRRTANSGLAFMPIQMMQEAVTFAERQGIRQYVMVTTMATERILRSLGVDLCRFGPPQQVGTEKAVALTIEINEKTHNAVFFADKVAANDPIYLKAA